MDPFRASAAAEDLSCAKTKVVRLYETFLVGQ